MIDLTRSRLSHIATHHVGNKGLGEALTLTEKQVEISDDFTLDTFMRYLTSGFKGGIYYKFKSKNEMHYHDVKSYAQEIFKDKGTFMENGKLIAEQLYNQSMHPKIHGGEFYVTYFQDCMIDGVIADAIGLFKTENKDTYLKVYSRTGGDMDIECDNGINIKKLDKGCMIFNIEQENGYKVAIVDSNNKIADCAFYWSEDFLNAKLRDDAYTKTANFIDTVKAFTEEKLNTNEGHTELFQAEVLTKSVRFLQDHDNFEVEDFNREIMEAKGLKGEFIDFRIAHCDKMDIKNETEFEISDVAVKKAESLAKMTLKLDKNYTVNITGGHDKLETGYDEEKGMKFYKLYYINEEIK